jgi:hypothetical protein
MAKNDQQDNYEKLLSANHTRMIDFVKFAETKNAALLTFCSVWIGSIITLLRANNNPLPMGYDKAFLATLPLLVIAALISLKSFLPKFLHNFHQSKGEMNLLYFRDIADCKVDNYGKAASERYLPQPDWSYTEAYLEDLTAQIAIQARIADQKFKAFHRAGWIVLVAFGMMALPIAVTLIRLADARAHALGWL